MGKGHPKLIELLWPTGTTARSDIESLFALRTQVPELLEELRQSPPSLSAPTSGESPSLPDPTEVFNSIVSLASDPEKQRELQEEAKDLLRSTPKGLETPKYTVEKTLDGPLFLGKPEAIEIRKYAPFTVARTNMSEFAFGATSSSGGTGFNTLASYLFGKNAQDEAMAMTMPVEVSATADGAGTMAFVLPKKYADAPPAPLDGTDVDVASVPARVVAAKAFAGVVTDAEVARQKAALLEAIAKDDTIAVADANAVSVLQYNSPLTVPWRRRNEIALVVELVDEAAAEPEGAADEAGANAQAGVASWYDAGVRL